MAVTNERTYQNSYRLEPIKPFDVTKVEMHLRNVMELNLKEFEYSDRTARDICPTIIEEIKTEVKAENFDRCRIVVYLVIGEKKMQGIQMHHSFMWDETRDRYASHTFETNGYFVRAVVYGIYYD